MPWKRDRLLADPFNIELRSYCLIESILDEKWIDLLDICEETPPIHCHLIKDLFEYFPLSMIDNERVIKLREGFKSNSLLSKKRSEILEINSYRNESINSFQVYRKERLSSSSSSSDDHSFHQSATFSSKAKLYEKSLNWIRIGKGECEIVETNRTQEISHRFWLLTSCQIRLVLKVNLDHQSNFYLLSNNSSLFHIQFKAKNELNYPNHNSLIEYYFKFYSIRDWIQFQEIGLGPVSSKP